MNLAINFLGCVPVFNKYGIPVASVLMPGRDDGKLLSSTNVAFKQGTDQVYVTASRRDRGRVDVLI
jgi:lactonase